VGLIYTWALVVGALVLLVDLLLAFVGAAVLGKAVRLAVRGTEVTGHVVHVRERRRRVGVRVAYETPAGKFETGGTSQRSQLGEPMTVRYDPVRPARATTWIWPARKAATGIPMMLAVAAASGGMILGSAFYFAGVHSSLQAPLVGGGFTLGIALIAAGYARDKYAELLRWRRMVQAPGRIKRFNERATNGVLISFESADGRQEFWARTGSVVARVGDTVTVYYDPSKPAWSATVEDFSTVRAYAIGSTVLALALFAGVALQASLL
jgi:Protein of unknown function (DUF3592)